MKIKNFINNNKAKIIGSTATLAIAASHSVFAADSTTVSSSITSSFQTVVTDTLATIASIAPIALGVFGAMFVWRKAKSFFNSMNR